MKLDAVVRPVEQRDYTEWRLLWDGYNAFYGRSGATALDEKITAKTWSRFFAPGSSVHAFVAEVDGEVVGLVHCMFHPSTSRDAEVCYLQDLFTAPSHRARGIGRALIEHVYQFAARAGSSRVYWHTQRSNATARTLYDSLAQHDEFIRYTHEL